MPAINKKVRQNKVILDFILKILGSITQIYVIKRKKQAFCRLFHVIPKNKFELIKNNVNTQKIIGLNYFRKYVLSIYLKIQFPITTPVIETKLFLRLYILGTKNVITFVVIK
ncbi:hypothetical protein GCM10010976_14600 [Bizionia arctica]|uniref:Uncharacterized protein n=1 Tax=Bizionia arctica TaxID=1495645 RepID=A0A917GG43_9FLAO|nr:hypothetical protein GCM10010976_14600 [Bizionia arctica]